MVFIICYFVCCFVFSQLLKEKPKTIVVGGPDFEEGPECAIWEDEFYDAIDAQLDKMESYSSQLSAIRTASMSHAVSMAFF